MVKSHPTVNQNLMIEGTRSKRNLLWIRVKPPIKILFLSFVGFSFGITIIKDWHFDHGVIVNYVFASYLFFWGAFFVLINEMIRLGQVVSRNV